MKKIIFSLFAMTSLSAVFASDNCYNPCQKVEEPCGCAKIVREPCCKPEPVVHKVEVALDSCCE